MLIENLEKAIAAVSDGEEEVHIKEGRKWTDADWVTLADVLTRSTTKILIIRSARPCCRSVGHGRCNAHTAAQGGATKLTRARARRR